MVSPNEHMDDLIGKVLAREATASEKQEVEAWIHEHEDHARYFRQLQEVFDQAASPEIQALFDTDAAWQKVRHKIKPAGRQHWMNRIPLVYRVAAGIALIIGTGYLLFPLISPDAVPTELAASSKIVNDTLPDGSLTSLNRSTKMVYTYDVKQKVRKVTLQGEAFFQVKHEEEKPFIIETQGVYIKDIGTQFNVMAFPESTIVEVMVTEGEVYFYSDTNTGIQLVAGQTGIYDKTSRTFTRQEVTDTNRLAYKTRIFRFNNTRVSEIIHQVNEVYGVSITLAQEEIGNCHITVNFDEETPQTIAEIIAETLDLVLDTSQGRLTLSGKGCPKPE